MGASTFSFAVVALFLAGISMAIDAKADERHIRRSNLRGESRSRRGRHGRTLNDPPLKLAEKEALLQLYDSTNGDSWQHNDGWVNRSSDPCNTQWHGVYCNNFGSVSDLSLPNNGLNGTIPPHIGNLTELEYLDLEHNNLIGTIPTEIGNLKAIDWLYLRANKLGGSIPTEIENLLVLSDIGLEENCLTGTIPTEIGELTQLSFLSLHNNSLTGTIPAEIGNLTMLWEVNIGSNGLRGRIPTEIWNLSQMDALILTSNNLSGTIPSEIGMLKQLRLLDLEQNNFGGTIPRQIGNLIELQELNIGMNKFIGTIPSSIGSLGKLEFLSMSSNGLVGGIPTSVGELSNLEELNLYSNQLGSFYMGGRPIGRHLHSIPSRLGRLRFLRELNLSNNSFIGLIPVEISELVYLRNLDLSDNGLENRIPTDLGNLERLRNLDISSNELSGVIPSELAQIKTLQNLYLTGNQGLKTPAPLSLCNIDMVFDMQSNDSYYCPEERNILSLFYESTNGNGWNDQGTGDSEWNSEYTSYCNWTGVACSENGDVVSLDLPKNGLFGRIPTKISHLVSLQQLDLADNMLEGGIPSQLGNLTNLTILRLAYNFLTGNIPSEISNNAFSLLHLHSNKLSGTAPNIIKTTSTIKNGTIDQIYITDCGSPSEFERPIKCIDCSVCCNSQGQCEVVPPQQALSLNAKTGIFMVSLFVFLCFMWLLAYCFGAKLLQIAEQCVPQRDFSGEITCDKGTVYNFFLAPGRPIGWVLAASTLALQIAIFVIFLQASVLDFSKERDFRYSRVCPRDSLVCKDLKDINAYGWTVFGILLFVKLSPDVWIGMKRAWVSGRFADSEPARDNKWKVIRYFFGGAVVDIMITGFAVWTSVRYNMATAFSNTQLIIQAAILLFVNDMDELVFNLCEAISPSWVRLDEVQPISNLLQNHSDRIGKAEKTLKDVKDKSSKLKDATDGCENQLAEMAEEIAEQFEEMAKELKEAKNKSSEQLAEFAAAMILFQTIIHKLK